MTVPTAIVIVLGAQGLIMDDRAHGDRGCVSESVVRRRFFEITCIRSPGANQRGRSLERLAQATAPHRNQHGDSAPGDGGVQKRHQN